MIVLHHKLKLLEFLKKLQRRKLMKLLSGLTNKKEWKAWIDRKLCVYWLSQSLLCIELHGDSARASGIQMGSEQLDSSLRNNT